MNNTSFLNADYLDIIFYQRNKNYGGYELRKHYSQRVGKALILLLATVSSLTVLSFVFADHQLPVIMYKRDVPTDIKTIILPAIPPPPITEHKIQTQSPAQAKTIEITPPVITDDPITPNEEMPDIKAMVNAQSGPSNSEGNGTAQAGVPNGTGVAPAAVETKIEPPRIIAEQMPQFIGDMNAYLKSNLQYPKTARQEGISGLVVVKFVVNEDGSVSDATIVRSVGGGCDEEALRIVHNMPRWKPGKQNGIPVKVFFSLPFKFVLN